MSWYFFIKRDNGDLVSEGGVVPEHLAQCMEGSEAPGCFYSVRDVVDRPDWTVRIWDENTRQLVDRPLPVLVDRLDDIQARLLADPDFVARWNALNQNQRNQLRTGIMRVLAALIGGRRFRGENDPVELD